MKPFWKAALYIRLSREDGDKEESDSVLSQRDLLESFAAGQEDLVKAGVYVDDGYTGTDFERPAFQRMLREIKAGKIDCVIVKDLSRFGRNYVHSGKYLEEVFPSLGVRFIAVNDNIDSYQNPSSMDTILVPFKNIINDEYSRDISRKVRSSLDTKRKKGEFIGSFAPYGYQKSPENKNKLIPDPEAADVVKEIFSLFLSGQSIDGIVRKLNAAGVPNPSAYKQRQGLSYRRQSGSSLWEHSSVRRILKNRVYLGELVQGKRRVKSYKIHRAEALPEESWIVAGNTHEGIVSPSDFAKAQKLLGQNVRTSFGEPTLFAGFLRCGDCGRAMNRKSVKSGKKTYHYYICGGYKQDRSICSKHAIREDRLYTAVLETIKAQIGLAESLKRVLDRLKERARGQDFLEKRRRQAQSLAGQIEKYQRLSESLYPDWKAGDLTREEYHSLKSAYGEKKKALQQELDVLMEEPEEDDAFLREFSQKAGVTVLTRELLCALVDKIEVYEGNRIKVCFRFSAGFQELSENLSL